MAITWEERVDSYSLTKIGVSQEGGRATVTYVATLGDDDTLEDLILEVLGSSTPAGDGSIERILPKAMPHLLYFYASRIEQIQGIGGDGERVDITDEWLEAEPITDTFWEPPKYLVTIEFTRRNYAILPDESITVVSDTYYDDAGDSQSYWKTEEYYRFCEFEVKPAADLLTAQIGQLTFATSTGALTTKTPAPHGFGAPGFIQIRMPKSTVVWSWYGVPYSYITSPDSILASSIGYINQKAFLHWPAGTLLFAGLSVKRYPPAVPERETWVGTTFSTSMLCDIVMIWEQTSRTLGGTAPTPAQSNWIAAGWNLAPWISNRKFYYVVSHPVGSAATPADWVPTYPGSIPFQYLFTDPDV